MTAKAHVSSLPPSLPPRGLNRVQAAEYIGVSPSKFDELVQDHRMPYPKRVDGRVVWDLHKLDLAFTALDEVEAPKVSKLDMRLGT